MKRQPWQSTQELTRSQIKRPTLPIVSLLEEHGFTQKGMRGATRVLIKGSDYPKAVLHFFDKMFLSAYVHESDERNLGKMNEQALRLYLEGNLCLAEMTEDWGQVRRCKLERGHEGLCSDADGPFAREAS